MSARTIRTPEQIAADARAYDEIPDTALVTPAEAVPLLRYYGRPLSSRSLDEYRYRKPEAIRFFKQGRTVSYRVGDLRRFALGDLINS